MDVIREGRHGDGGAGKNAGNNWHKFQAGSKIGIRNGKHGLKHDGYNEKKRKPWNSGGMVNRDGERTDE